MSGFDKVGVGLAGACLILFGISLLIRGRVVFYGSPKNPSKTPTGSMEPEESRVIALYAVIGGTVMVICALLDFPGQK